jgi:leader peptidase (prepilin peptidase)/N-methyltransferase
MPLAIAVLIFLFGTAVGSFLNVVVMRFGVSPLRGRSRCPYCNKTLEWFELIPLFSFLIQKGRCRTCKNALSRQYPLIEALTGVMFLLVFWRFTMRFPDVISSQFLIHNAFWIWPLVVLWWYYGSVLIAISAYDVRRYLIPDAFVEPAIGVAFLAMLYQALLSHFRQPLFPESGLKFSQAAALMFGRIPFGVFGSAFLGVLVAVGFLGALYWFSKGRAMGFGDVKLGAFMGLALGWPDVLIALLVAFIIGSIWSIAAIILKRKTLKSLLPFGPFLAFGMMIAMLGGDFLLNLYFRVLPQIFF